MKKVFILVFFAAILVSCGKTKESEMVDLFLREEVKELETLIMIQKRTKDTLTVKLIDSIKIEYKNSALETLGMLKIKDDDFLVGDLSEAIETTEKYIKLCEP